MSYGNTILSHRKRLELTQRQLADRVGCTDGYIAHLESELKFPSINVMLALSDVFSFTIEAQQEFLTSVEKKRVEKSSKRIRTRGVATRELLKVRHASEETRKTDLAAERIAHDLEENPDLRTAYYDLRTALADPQMRDTVLNTLRAFSRSSRSNDQE